MNIAFKLTISNLFHTSTHVLESNKCYLFNSSLFLYLAVVQRTTTEDVQGYFPSREREVITFIL